ncbi:MAG TPA: hypothetical protein VEA79_14630 [Phenylobacterium sp.]|nr:hypothetical protein [Phenylobacterium sp.]
MSREGVVELRPGLRKRLAPPPTARAAEAADSRAEPAAPTRVALRRCAAGLMVCAVVLGGAHRASPIGLLLVQLASLPALFLALGASGPLTTGPAARAGS